MESLNNLRPAAVEELLAACPSVKVKHLFLYLADRAGHQRPGFLECEKLDLGIRQARHRDELPLCVQISDMVPKELGAVTVKKR